MEGKYQELSTVVTLSNTGTITTKQEILISTVNKINDNTVLYTGYGNNSIITLLLTLNTVNNNYYSGALGFDNFYYNNNQLVHDWTSTKDQYGNISSANAILTKLPDNNVFP